MIWDNTVRKSHQVCPHVFEGKRIAEKMSPEITFID